MLFIGGVRRCCGRRLGMWGPLVRPVDHATWLGGQVSSLHHLWALDTLSTASAGHVDKTIFGNAPTQGTSFPRVILSVTMPYFGHSEDTLADRPHLGSVEPVLCATSFPHVILSMTMPYFGHNKDMHGFWSIWYFSVIRCS
jgi:hypothetical protein